MSLRPRTASTYGGTQPIIRYNGGAAIDAVYTANPEFRERRIRYAYAAWRPQPPGESESEPETEAETEAEDRRAQRLRRMQRMRREQEDRDEDPQASAAMTLPEDVRQLIVAHLPHLLLKHMDVEIVADCFANCAQLYSTVTDPIHDALNLQPVVSPLLTINDKICFLPHPALPLVLECAVEVLIDYDYPYQEPSRQDSNPRSAVHAGFIRLPDFNSAHLTPFEATHVPANGQLLEMPWPNSAHEAQNAHTYWTVPASDEDDTIVKQTYVVLLATRLHWRTTDEEDPPEHVAQRYNITSRGLQEPVNGIPDNQLIARARKRNELQDTYSIPHPDAKHRTMIYDKQGPNSDILPPWKTAAIGSRLHKTTGSPLLPLGFHIGNHFVPLPALFDDLYTGYRWSLVANIREFLTDTRHGPQNALFGSRNNATGELSILNMLTQPPHQIPATELPPTDANGIAGRHPHDRFFDVCLQTERYMRPDDAQ